MLIGSLENQTRRVPIEKTRRRERRGKEGVLIMQEKTRKCHSGNKKKSVLSRSGLGEGD